jgi:hypothetical protein
LLFWRNRLEIRIMQNANAAWSNMQFAPAWTRASGRNLAALLMLVV